MFDQILFLQVFPQFSDVNKYPQPLIDFWVSYSETLLNTTIWGDLYNNGLSLLIAHNLTLAAQNGQVQGILSNKSVDSVSAGYDVQSISYKDAGHYNKTVYGQQFWALSRLVGTRPLNVG